MTQLVALLLVLQVVKTEFGCKMARNFKFEFDKSHQLSDTSNFILTQSRFVDLRSFLRGVVFGDFNKTQKPNLTSNFGFSRANSFDAKFQIRF